MPRIFDYILDEPLASGRYGHNELTAKQMRDEKAAVPEYCPRHLQFSHSFAYAHPVMLREAAEEKRAEWLCYLTDKQARMDLVHQWLSDSMDGPWHWTESRDGNYGHDLDINIHIERHCDQKLLRAAWLDLFKFEPDKHEHLERLAVLKGALPPKIDFVKWFDRNDGFNVTAIEGDRERFEIAFHFPTIEDRFLAAFPDSDRSCIGASRYHVANTSKLLMWLEKNAGSQQNFYRVGDRLTAIRPQCPEFEQAFERQWSKDFKKVIGADGKLIEYVGEIPCDPQREIPAAFMDYLDGKCAFSMVPRVIETITPPLNILRLS